MAIKKFQASNRSVSDKFKFDNWVGKCALVNPTKMTTGVRTDYDPEGLKTVLVGNMVDLETGDVFVNCIFFSDTLIDQLSRYLNDDGDDMTVVNFIRKQNREKKASYNTVETADDTEFAKAEAWIEENYPSAFEARIAELEAAEEAVDGKPAAKGKAPFVR